MEPKKITLPSGRSAVMRPIKWWDKVTSANANVDLMVLMLACRIVTIGGKPLTLETAQEMDLCEAAPIVAAVTAAFCEAMGLNEQPPAPSESEGVRLH